MSESVLVKNKLFVKKVKQFALPCSRFDNEVQAKEAECISATLGAL